MSQGTAEKQVMKSALNYQSYVHQERRFDAVTVLISAPPNRRLAWLTENDLFERKFIFFFN